jgi:hypothetical protein
LARKAAQEGWSVRTVEERARASNRDRVSGRVEKRARSDGRGHPDQDEAAKQIADVLSGGLGAEVRVEVIGEGGYRAELTFSTVEEAVELVRRLRPRAVA